MLYTFSFCLEHFLLCNVLYTHTHSLSLLYRGLEVLRPSTISNAPRRAPSAPVPPVPVINGGGQVYQPLNSNAVDRQTTCTDYYVLMTPRGIQQVSTYRVYCLLCVYSWVYELTKVHLGWWLNGLSR